MEFFRFKGASLRTMLIMDVVSSTQDAITASSESLHLGDLEVVDVEIIERHDSPGHPTQIFRLV